MISKDYINKNSILSAYKLIRDSISGVEFDYTTLQLSKAVLILSIPMILEVVMESVFAIVDVFFVSKLGSDAIATVGITESLLTILYGFCFGIATATNAIVSRRIGEGNPEAASKTAFQAILTGLAVSLPISIIGFFFSKDLLGLMGASSNIVNNLSGYTTIMLTGNGVIMLLFTINAIFRSAGDAAKAMQVLWFANIINIILDPCLIYGIGPFPQLGVQGAAVATTTGRGIGVLFQLYILFSGKSRIKLSVNNLKIDFKIILSIIKLSLGSVGQNIIATSSWVGIIRIISSFGSDVVAGYTIAIRIMIFALMPGWGLSNAASTLVGQNLGAGKPERAEKAVWQTSIYSLVFFAFVGLIMFFYSDSLIGFFIENGSVHNYGVNCLKILSVGFIAFGIGMIMIHAINGAGDTVTPTIVNVFIFWLLEIPLAWLLGIKLNYHESGVFFAILIAEFALTITSITIFKLGRWKLKKV